MFKKSSKQPVSRNCFVCGVENHNGLKMTFYNDDEAQVVWSELVVPDYFNGYPGVVHGGIVATILDETSGRALLQYGDDDNLMLTTHMQIKYRKPTPTSQTLFAVGWMVRDSRGRAQVASEIRLADGTVTAECKSIVVNPPAAFLKTHNWSEEKPFWKVRED
ncbi:MAG: PaaI family thioesterase [Syntrophomonadaceae bacterium]|jgi:acyl-coenzyme A thioesterase PaaI-like protein